MSMIPNLMLIKVKNYLNNFIKLHLRVDNNCEWIFDRAGLVTYLVMFIDHKRNLIKEYVFTEDELEKHLEKVELHTLTLKSTFDNIIPFPIKKEVNNGK